MLLSRGLAVLLAFPLLRKMGLGLKWQEAVVVWWGGLRGAVSLALGFEIFHFVYDGRMWGDGQYAACKPDGCDPAHMEDISQRIGSLDCRDQPAVILLGTLLVVLFTITINGMTMSPLMKLLKLTLVSEERKFCLNIAYEKLRARTEEEILRVRSLRGFDQVHWVLVESSVLRKKSYDHTEITDHLRAAWKMVIHIERSFYLAKFERGVLLPEAYEVLDALMNEMEAALESTRDTRADDDLGEASLSPMAKLYNDRFYRFTHKLLRGKAEVSYASARALERRSGSLARLRQVGPLQNLIAKHVRWRALVPVGTLWR